MQPRLIYFSSISGNTHRFMQKLDLPSLQIPLYAKDEAVHATAPYVLVTPPTAGATATERCPNR